MVGQRLAHYVINEHLGSGGMGDVYRARDTKLDRSVALKFLRDDVAFDSGRVARFQREAKALAALNHPHIAAIHGQEDADGRTFLVMEFVPGETLEERIGGRPLPLAEALGIARQISEALETAHENGIIHRDLKPANVKITPDGRVRVLDFGLAKMSAGDADLQTDCALFHAHRRPDIHVPVCGFARRAVPRRQPTGRAGPGAADHPSSELEAVV